MNIYKADFTKIKNNQKSLKRLINEFDNYVDSEGNITDNPYYFHEYLRNISIECANMIQNILQMECENY